MSNSLFVYRYCKKCEELKPPRSHHCSICNKCYLRMDHHCPWVGNCVAFNNHKLFLLFTFYTTTGCAYSALTMGLHSYSSLFRHHGISLKMDTRQNCYLASTLSIALSICICILLVMHLYFILTSQSSIECADLMDFNPFFESARP